MFYITGGGRLVKDIAIFMQFLDLPAIQTIKSWNQSGIKHLITVEQVANIHECFECQLVRGTMKSVPVSVY